jgi:hypothetical protein
LRIVADLPVPRDGPDPISPDARTHQIGPSGTLFELVRRVARFTPPAAPCWELGLVTIDVQGSEGALEGMAVLLARSERAEVLVEFWSAGPAPSGYGAERLLGLCGGGLVCGPARSPRARCGERLGGLLRHYHCGMK